MKKTTDEQLREAVANSTSIASALRSLGLRAASGSYTHYSKRIKELGCDTSHHKGRGNFGHTFSPSHKLPPEKILVKRTTGIRTTAKKLRRALTEIGREYICSECGQLPEWRGNALTLDVDHINQDWMDDRPENLRFLCPNCHSQFTRGQRGKTLKDGRRKDARSSVMKPGPVEKPVKRDKHQVPWNKGVRRNDRAVSISDDELKTLVWSKPMREAAKQFNISDVALKKECKKRKIDTPPRGYWLKRVNSV